MKAKILFILFFALFIQTNGQQTPLYSEHVFNKLLINPALSGNFKTFNGNAFYRRQWEGIEGAPITSSITSDIPLFNQKVGIGLNFISDKIGIFNNTDFSISYAYHIQFNKSKLSFGLQGGLSYLNANYLSVRHSYENGIIDNSFNDNQNIYTPIFGTGCYFQTNQFYVGLSAPNLTKTNKNITNSSFDKPIYLMSGYIFRYSKNIFIKPSIFVRYTSGSPISIDLSANIWIKKTISLGLSVRPSDCIVSMIELKLNRFLKVGFSHDFNISSLSKYNRGSNEFMLTYQLAKENSKYLTMQY